MLLEWVMVIPYYSTRTKHLDAHSQSFTLSNTRSHSSRSLARVLRSRFAYIISVANNLPCIRASYNRRRTLPVSPLARRHKGHAAAVDTVTMTFVSDTGVVLDTTSTISHRQGLPFVRDSACGERASTKTLSTEDMAKVPLGIDHIGIHTFG